MNVTWIQHELTMIPITQRPKKYIDTGWIVTSVKAFFSRYLLWYRPLQVILFVGLERKNWWLVSWSIMRSSQVTADDVLHALQCVFNSIQANAWHSANKRGIKSCTSPTRHRTGVRSVEWIYWRENMSSCTKMLSSPWTPRELLFICELTLDTREWHINNKCAHIPIRTSIFMAV